MISKAQRIGMVVTVVAATYCVSWHDTSNGKGALVAIAQTYTQAGQSILTGQVGLADQSAGLPSTTRPQEVDPPPLLTELGVPTELGAIPGGGKGAPTPAPDDSHKGLTSGVYDDVVDSGAVTMPESVSDVTVEYDGEINPGSEQDVYDVNGIAAGEVLTLRVSRTSGTLDTWLSLFDPSGTEVAYDDDSAGGSDSLLRFTTTIRGNYRVRVSSYRWASTGRYHLTISRSGGSAASDLQYDGEINPGSEQDVYDVNGIVAGEVLTLRVNRTSGNLDTWLSLFDPSGTEVAYDDDSGGGSDSLLGFTTVIGGNYRVRVSSYRWASTGRYHLTISRSGGVGLSGATVSPWDVSWIPSDSSRRVAMASVIDSIVISGSEGGAAGSGLSGYGSALLGYATTSIGGNPAGVNPAFAMAMFRKEANFAKPNTIANSHRNPGNLRCTGIYGDSGCSGGFAEFSSMDAGIKAYFWLLTREYKPGGTFSRNRNCTDLHCIIVSYCPPVECDTAAYEAQIASWAQHYRDRMLQAAPIGTAPSTPTGVRADGISSSQIRVSWSSVSGATSYRVDGHLCAPNTTTSTSLVCSGYGPGQTFYYRVYARNSYGESAPNDWVAGTTTSGGGSSCSGTRISQDQRAAGSLSSSSTSQYYCFSGSAGQWVTFRMFAQNNSFDPMLRLYPAGRSTVVMDDGESGTQHSFQAYQLPYTGDYRLEATHFSGTGNYTLRIDSGRKASASDVNTDCAVNSVDYVMVQQRLGNSEDTGDVNVDGIVNTIDLLMVRDRLATFCP